MWCIERSPKWLPRYLVSEWSGLAHSWHPFTGKVSKKLIKVICRQLARSRGVNMSGLAHLTKYAPSSVEIREISSGLILEQKAAPDPSNSELVPVKVPINLIFFL